MVVILYSLRKHRLANVEPLHLRGIQGYVSENLWSHINQAVHNLRICDFLLKDTLCNIYLI